MIVIYATKLKILLKFSKDNGTADLATMRKMIL